MSDRSIDAVAALLRRHGIAADVRRVGQAGDVVAVSASAGRFAELRSLSEEIRALGFRYVTLEITASEEL